MSASGLLACKRCGCTTPPCDTCCYRVTFTGVTIRTDAVYEQVDGAYEAHFTESEGSLNGVAFIICTQIPFGGSYDKSDFVPFVTKTHLEPPGGGTPYSYQCGYAKVSVKAGTGGETGYLVVMIGSSYGAPEQTFAPFKALIPIGAKSLACSSTDTFSGENILDSTGAGFPTGEGSVVVEIVPGCDENVPYPGPDCEVESPWRQSICDEPDCPPEMMARAAARAESREYRLCKDRLTEEWAPEHHAGILASVIRTVGNCYIIPYATWLEMKPLRK